MKMIVIAACAATFSMAAAPSFAAAPNSSSSCVAQLSQGATPNGASEAPPGLLGGFISAAASSDPGVVGDQTKGLSHTHGNLGSCIPDGAG
jgi:hypothetical protein